MSLTIHPLHLGEAEVDQSFTVWGTEAGKRHWVPIVSYLILGADQPVLVDAGFSTPERMYEHSGIPTRQSADQTLEAQLARHDLDPADIRYLIHTHLHIDHAGLDYKLPNARIFVQRRELQYGAAPLFPAAFYDRLDIRRLVEDLWDQVELLDGDAEIVPGIQAIFTGGHSPGHQMFYVELDSGRAIITGDNTYNLALGFERGVPPGYFTDLSQVMAALKRIARDGKHILPMHDAVVFERYREGLS